MQQHIHRRHLSSRSPHSSPSSRLPPHPCPPAASHSPDPFAARPLLLSQTQLTYRQPIELLFQIFAACESRLYTVREIICLASNMLLESVFH